MAPSQAASSAVRSSLDRLKALDSLPNLKAQLEEAKQLCTHSARADMICKWLMETLKKDPKVCTNPTSWDLLATTARLLSPERLATLLGSSNLLKVAGDGIRNAKDDQAVLGISAYLTLLNELSSASNGAALKAIFSTDATKAAPFLGAWLRRISSVSAETDSVQSANKINILLPPAADIWRLRRQGAQDDELFAKECLVPAASLLTVIDNASSTQPAKRKLHDIEGAPTATAKRTLETMLARHVFLPARLAFLGSHEQQQRARKREAQATSLGDRLQALKLAVHSGEAALESLPALLDVALRCVPATTPRQRLKERPWVEALFAALLDCVTKNGHLLSAQILTEMLAVLGKRATLSRDTLLKLATTHGAISADDQSKPEWNLLAQIIELDASAFAQKDKADGLFEAVSTAESAALDDGSTITSMLKDRIIVPVMRAFARNRSLPAFIDLWRTQLLRRADEQSVWLQLDHDFTPLVEDSLNVEQVVEVARRLRSELSAPSAVRGVPADTIILAAMLSGVRSPELADAIHTELGEVLSVLLKDLGNVRLRVGGKPDWPHVWRLLTRALSLWLPLQLLADRISSDPGHEAKELQTSLLSSSAVAIARQLVDRKSRGEKVSEGTTIEVHDARCFLAIMVNACNVQRAGEFGLLEASENAPGDDGLPMLVRHPRILQHSSFARSESDGKGQQLIEGCFRSIKAGISADSDSVRGSEGLSALFGTSSDGQDVIARNLVDWTLGGLKASQQNDDGIGALTALQLIAIIPTAALANEQRARVVNEVVGMKPHGKHGVEIFRKRLALLIQLLQQPCPQADLMITPALLWKLADDAKAPAKDQAQGSGRSIGALLEQLAQLVTSHLLTARRDDTVKATITKLASELDGRMETWAKDQSRDADYAELGVTAVVLESLSRHLRPELKEECIDTKHVQKYASSLVVEATDLTEDRSKEPAPGLETIFEALLRPPHDIMLTSKSSKRLAEVVEQVFKHRKLFDEETAVAESDSETNTRLLVLAFRTRTELLGAEGSGDVSNTAKLAIRLLQHQIQPVEHSALLLAFSKLCEKADAQQRLRLINHLVPADASPSTSGLILLKRLLAMIARDDFASVKESSTEPPSTTLRRLLAVIGRPCKVTLCRKAADCVAIILRQKTFMTSQSTIETTISALKLAVQHQSAGSQVVFRDVCRLFTILLQQYRSRLRDRMHLVVELLQALVSCFFFKTKRGPTRRGPLAFKYAHMLARILQLLCEPPRLYGKRSTSELVDEARKAQAHVGQYVRYVLHHYCSQVLSGTLGEGVREALMPGLWAVIEAMEASEPEAVKSLSAAMNNSERAVLRGVYDEYKTFGKWKGG